MYVYNSKLRRVYVESDAGQMGRGQLAKYVMRVCACMRASLRAYVRTLMAAVNTNYRKRPECDGRMRSIGWLARPPSLILPSGHFDRK